MPFGLAIAVSGFASPSDTDLGSQSLSDRRISYSVLERMVHFGCAIYEKVEKVIRPRLASFSMVRAWE